jgi:hypothetical protein
MEAEMASDQVDPLAIGEQVEGLLTLARAVVMPGRPESTLRRSIKVDGLLVDVNISSLVPRPTLVPARPTLMQRILRRLPRP